MGSKDLPIAGAEQHIKTLERFGWTQRRQTGAHVMMRKDGHRATLSVPVHKGKDLRRGTLASILREAGISTEEYCSEFR